MVPIFTGSAGGSKVNAVNGTVTSDLTAQSGINTSKPGVTNSNEVLDANVLNLVTAGVIDTSVSSSTPPGGGQEVTSHARTANVSLLGGAITAKAVDTIATAIYTTDGQSQFSINTTFVDLIVGGNPIPVNVRPNFGINIPGLASVTLNAQYAQHSANGTTVDADGLVITLLKGVGNSPLGTVIQLNPIYAAVGQKSASQHNLAGYGYATKITSNVGSSIKVNAGPSAEETMPPTGTQGKDLTNSTAAVNLGTAAQVKAISTTVNGTEVPDHSDGTVTVRLAKVNLLGGLIKADALTGVAHVSIDGSSLPVSTESTSLVNLVIGGQAIPINVSPNTVINLAGIAQITINQQAASYGVSFVRVLDIKLLVAKYGLPAGAEIEVGTAETNIVI